MKWCRHGAVRGSYFARGRPVAVMREMWFHSHGPLEGMVQGTREDSMGETPPLLDVHDLTVAYRRRPVLWNVDFEIREPQLLGIVGPNGAGKSTLLKAMLELIPALSGSVAMFGKSVQQVRKRIGYVPQRESVDWDFPISVRETVLMGTYGQLGWFRRAGQAQYETVDRCLADVGMEAFAERQIGRLSGGQQQRVFLARALAQNAEIYFLDEPFAGVDAATEEVILKVLRQLRQQGKLIIVVHHDLLTVQRSFDSVLLLNGRLIAWGPVATTLTAENLIKTYGGHLPILDHVGARFEADSVET
ncbi:MAG: metal ABC transporter ATP-binding protein [Planctomycetaceae bacterium]